MTTAIAPQNPPVKQAEIMLKASSPKSASDVPTGDILVRRYHRLKIKYQARNATYIHLDSLYRSDPRAHGMQGQSDSTEIIVNRFFDIVNTGVDFAGVPPSINFIPPDLSEEGRHYADQKEKYLYANWDLNEMDALWPEVTFDQWLLGTGFMGVLPTTELDGFVEFRRFTPVHFYPEVFGGSRRVKYYFNESKLSREQVIEDYGEGALKGAGASQAWRSVWPEGTLDPDQVVVLEYCDAEWLIIMVMDKIVSTINHKFMFCPARIFPNIVKPDIVGGVSAVATYEALQRYESELFSVIGDLAAYWADPMIVAKSDKLTGDDINLGGMTIIGKDDDMKMLVPNVDTSMLDQQIKRTAQIVHDGTIPEDLYGRLQAKGAIGSAPVLSGLRAKFMMKMNSLYRRNGRNLASLNVMGLSIAEKLYKNKSIRGSGYRKGRYFELNMTGAEIGEHKAHRVFWDSSVTDPDRHKITQIQMAGARLQSKFTTIENLGMSAPDQFELMRLEDMYDIKKQAALARLTQQIQAQAEPGLAGMERNRVAAEKGGKVYPTADGEQRPTPGRPAGAGAGQPATGGGIDPQRVAADMQAVKKLKGEVYLVTVGQSIDVAITDKLDKATILNAPTMQTYKGSLRFIVIKPGQAREEWVKVN